MRKKHPQTHPPEPRGGLNDLLENVQTNIWLADPVTLKRRYVSHYAVDLLGYPEEEWLHDKDFWHKHIHPNDRERTLARLSKLIRTEDHFSIEYRLIARDGRVLWVRDNITVKRGKHGRPLAIYGAMTDITELRQTADALRKSQERMRLIIESAKDYAIFTFDLNGRIESWNSGAQTMMGYEPAEVIGRPGHILFTPEDNEASEAENEIQKALLLGRSVNERWHVHKSGRRFWGSGLMMPIKDDSGRPIGLLKILRDATEQMRLAERAKTLNTELELHVAERTAQLEAANRELETFSYTVSHDLQAPLRKIDGFSKLILEEYGQKLDETGRRHLERIRNASQQMSRMIDDLLRLARVVRGTMRGEDVDLSRIAQEIVSELERSQPDRKAEFIIAPGLIAKGDPELLRIALFNLLDNAWKFSSKQAKTRIELGAALMGNEMVFFVRDNGAGFDMAYANKLFHEFSRLHEKREFSGTGIGLATVQRIIRRHGGRIWAESEPGRGAAFYFTLTPGSPSVGR